MATFVPSDEAMASLLSQFDALHDRYKETIVEVRTLKTKLSTEMQKREAAEALCSDSDQERKRLMRTQGETFNKLLQQLEFRSKFEEVIKELNSLKMQLANKEGEHEQILSRIRVEYQTENLTLNNQIRQSQEELALRDAAVAHLERELSCVRSSMDNLRESSEKAMHDQALKYQHEIQQLNGELKHLLQEKNALENRLLQEKSLLEDRLLREKHVLEDRLLQENNVLLRRLSDTEKQLMTERAEHEKILKDSSFNRHAEAYKQKIMKLRKENENLRYQLLSHS